MPSVDELLGPPPVDHLLGPAPPKPKALAAPPAPPPQSADALLGPPPADHLLGPAPKPNPAAAAAPKPKPTVAPQPPGQVRPLLPKTHGALDQLRSDWRDYRTPTTGGAGRPGAAPGTPAGAKITAADRLTGDLGGVAGGVWHDAADRLVNDPVQRMTRGHIKADDLDVVEDVLGPVALSKMGPMPSKVRAPKEPLFADPAGQFGFSAREKPGPVYGAEKKPTERLDNALHRVRGNEKADKLAAVRSRDKIRKVLGKDDQAEGENLSRELEHAMVDPKRKLSDRAQDALGHVQTLKDQQRDDMNAVRRLAARTGGKVEDYLDDQGHVPRRVQGMAPAFDDGLVDHRDPITGQGRGVALNKTTSAMKGRASWRMLQPVGGKGEPIWVSKELTRKNPGRYDKLGDTITGSGGRQYRVRQPTMEEIEKHTAGTDQETKYHKNYFDLIHDDWARVRQVRRNLEVLDASLSDLKGRKMAFRGEWMRPTGSVSGKGKPEMTPQSRKEPDWAKSFVELPHIKQLRGWKFSPEIAEVFKDYKPGPGTASNEILSKINGTLTSSLFWNPIPHTWNVANDWAKARGWDWLPGRGGYASLVRNGAQAVQAVITKNETYRDLLREGASLMGGDEEARNFHRLMLDKGVKDISRDPGALSTLMHSFDLKGLAPQKLVASIYKAASHELWNASDTLMIQRILELKDRGLPTREAIKAAEKDIASYRVPSRVLQDGKIGRMISEQTRNPQAFLFGRYHYSEMKSWGTMFRDLYKGTPKERTEAAGKFLAAMILAHGAYPLMDKMARWATGNPDARMHRGGSVGMGDAVEQASSGQKEWMSVMSRILDLSPALRLTGEAANGFRDAFGRQIVNPQAKPMEQIAQGAEHAGSFLDPVNEAQQAMQPGGAGRLAARNLLVDIPSPKAAKGKRYAEQRDKKAAARKRREDPIIRAAGDLIP